MKIDRFMIACLIDWLIDFGPPISSMKMITGWILTAKLKTAAANFCDSPYLEEETIVANAHQSRDRQKT